MEVPRKLLQRDDARLQTGQGDSVVEEHQSERECSEEGSCLRSVHSLSSNRGSVGVDPMVLA